MSGTILLTTPRLRLRRHLPSDAPLLFERLGKDPSMSRYSGWNPYASEQAARETIQGFLNSYENPRFYGWAIESGQELIGTIGAYDYDSKENSIELGISIARPFWGQGYATEAIGAVLSYLTGAEQIRLVTAWCASDNIGSKKAMEKAGMRPAGEKPGALAIDDAVYDQLFYSYSR